MARHPDADIYRCEHCTHAFSDPASMPKQESYDTDYYDDTHRRWFEHPNTALFDRITAIIPRGGSLLDVGCGRGDLLRHVQSKRPDVQLTGIDYSPNQDEIIRFLQGDAIKLVTDSTLSPRSPSLNTYRTALRLLTVCGSCLNRTALRQS
jgi:SAM-dependent methyltransferase